MSELAGYVTDIPNVRGFKPMLAPAWLDLTASIVGVLGFVALLLVFGADQDPAVSPRQRAQCHGGVGRAQGAAVEAADGAGGSHERHDRVAQWAR